MQAINNVLGNELSVVLTGDRVRQDNLFDEIAHSPVHVGSP